jgi:hypothetical protein
MNIILGVIIGTLVGILNSYLLYLTVKKSLSLEKSKGRKLVIISYLIRFIILTCMLILVVKFLGKTSFIASAVSLVIITLISPFKLFLKIYGRRK